MCACVQAMASSLLKCPFSLRHSPSSSSGPTLPAYRTQSLVIPPPSPSPFRVPFPFPYSLNSVRHHSVRLAVTEQGSNRPSEDDSGAQFDISRLEQYTEKVPNEVLRVHAVVDGEDDQVLIFKGFSSSLMRATAFDPAEPVLPASATIRAIDRIRGPYNPAKVLLIKDGRGLSWQQFQTLLQEKGL